MGNCFSKIVGPWSGGSHSSILRKREDKNLDFERYPYYHQSYYLGIHGHRGWIGLSHFIWGLSRCVLESPGPTKRVPKVSTVTGLGAFGSPSS